MLPSAPLLRVFAVDDEPLALRVIAEHARHVPFVELVGTTTDPIAGLLRVQQGDVDVVLLDVQMAKLSGLQFMQLLGGQCAVVLTTAYPQYALDGYDYAVTDYLLKPISFERFLRAVHRVQAQRPQLAPAPALSASAVQLPPADFAAHLFVKTDSRLVKVDHAAICYIEGGRDYTTVVTDAGKVLTLSSVSKLLENLPPSRFVRVHKSYIVPLARITAVERQRIYTAQTVIPIGDAYRTSFARAVGNS